MKDTSKQSDLRVLITCIDFDERTGGGITAHNIFSTWSAEQIFIAHDKLGERSFAKANECYSFATGCVQNINVASINNSKPQHSIIKQKQSFNYTSKALQPLKNVLVLSRIISKYGNFSSFFNWVENKNIDIVYAMPHKLEHIAFLNVFMEKYPNLRFYLHIVDDWIRFKTVGYLGIHSIQFKKKLIKIFEKSEKLFCISELMCSEYKKEYGFTFVKLHNPIKPKKIIQFEKQIGNGYTSILFAGTIEHYNINEIKLIDKILYDLFLKYNLKSHFNLYGSIRNNTLKTIIDNLNIGKHKGLLPYSEIEREYDKHDILLLPMTFDKDISKRIRLSLPTKISDYLNSPSEILILAPSNTALFLESKKYQWGTRIESDDFEDVQKVILQLVDTIKNKESDKLKRYKYLEQTWESNFFNLENKHDV